MHDSSMRSSVEIILMHTHQCSSVQRRGEEATVFLNSNNTAAVPRDKKPLARPTVGGIQAGRLPSAYEVNEACKISCVPGLCAVDPCRTCDKHSISYACGMRAIVGNEGPTATSLTQASSTLRSALFPPCPSLCPSDRPIEKPPTGPLTSTVPNSVRPNSRKPFTSVLAAVTLETPAALRPDSGVSGHSYPVSMQPHTRFTCGARMIRILFRADRMVARNRSMSPRGRKGDTEYFIDNQTRFENACESARNSFNS